MGRPTVIRRAGVLGLILLALTTVACGQNPAATTVGDNPSPGCNLYDNLHERIVSLSLNELGGKYPSLGDSATYITYLYDQGGHQIGTVYGKATVPNSLPNGDLLEFSEESIHLPAGIVDAQGLYDITRGFAGDWQFLPAMGSTGSYINKMGKRSFHIITVGKDLDASIDLCPIG